MNKKWIILGVVSAVVIGSVAYLIYRKRKNKTQTNDSKSNDSKSKIEPLQDLKKSSSVDNNSQAVKITEKKLNQLSDVLGNYEYKNNSVYDKGTGGKISENAGWSVWGLLNRNYNSLLDGVNNDKSINSETKEYALKVLEKMKMEIEKVFPSNIYNTNSKLYKKYNLDKIKITNIYNEQV
jgi:gas vesicle protein